MSQLKAKFLFLCVFLSSHALIVRATTLVPAEGHSYIGAYMDFGDTEDDVTPEKIARFEKLVGKHQAIVASSSFWGKKTFPLENVKTIDQYGAIPLIYWSPWGPPYEQYHKPQMPDPYSLTNIVSGKCDAYIDAWGTAAAEWGKPLFVSFACEMNANWFPWGGPVNGGGKVGAELYKAAWKHVVDRVRARGATNVQWVFQANSTSHPDTQWNSYAAYWPGSQYVDWLGMSVYGQITPGDGVGDWIQWKTAMDLAYKQLAQLDPDKPIMLAEFGVGEFPKSGNKSQWLKDAFATMSKGKYPRLKAAVFWHELWQNSDETWSNLRVNSDPKALDTFRSGLRDSYWLATPIQS